MASTRSWAELTMVRFSTRASGTQNTTTTTRTTISSELIIRRFTLLLPEVFRFIGRRPATISVRG